MLFPVWWLFLFSAKTAVLVSEWGVNILICYACSENRDSNIVSKKGGYMWQVISSTIHVSLFAAKADGACKGTKRQHTSLA